MDPVRDKYYIEEMRKQAKEDAAIKRRLRGLKRKMERNEADRCKNQNKVLKMIDEIKTLACAIPPNVKDLYEKEILMWIEEDAFSYETHNFHAMLDEVRKQPFMTFVGVPGSGKSVTIRHIALILKKEGYEIVPIRDVRKIEDYCDARIGQVFVIDDMVGVVGLNKQKFESLIDNKKIISNPDNKGTKVLMSCRKTVFYECPKSFFSNEKNLVKLYSPLNTLNDDDKQEILQRHGLSRDLISPEMLQETSDMFPLLCNLFSKKEKK
ncbi:uncharacterized protein LOC134266939 isoform X2 [Saccostrea cucullata]|uniref:uncharacterized protein LOC134266939 isoform X2 n=1 Tax=Saccostrea cuccullata TaxID=36930 RepID=UPI002ED3F79C